MTRRVTHLIAGAILLCGLLTPDLMADPLYTVTKLGPASPSAASPSGQGQFEPSGSYLPLLSATQQAAFQAGSFDGYAHPATFQGGPFFMDSGGDIVRTNLETSPEVVSPVFVTSNNLGVTAGTGNEYFYAESDSANQLVVFTPKPHTVTYSPTDNWQTTTVQSPGYLSVLWASSTLATAGMFQGLVAGINDHGNLALTEYSYPGPSYTQVDTPHFYGPQGDASLGSLGGTNGMASALNNSNQVVGWSDTASGAQHAFLYTDGSMRDLNLLIPPLSGITLVDAVGIDSAGDIVAYGIDSAGQTNEYYLTPAEVPAPEPSTLVIVGAMVAALAARGGYGRVRARCQQN
jgi:probable HAF family extracellular repeat protein